MCLLRFLGHTQCLPVSLPQVPGFLPAKNATPLPAITVEILSVFSRLSLGTNLCPTKSCEPSHPQPYNENLSFPPLHSLSTLSVLFCFFWGQVLLGLHFILGHGLFLFLDCEP